MILPGCAVGLTLFLAAMPLREAGRKENLPVPLKPHELTLEKLFPIRPFAGQSARDMAFSHNARYLAYLWNPYGEQGADLYIHDTETGQTRRVTSLEGMKAFEAPEWLEKFRKKADRRERDWKDAQAQMEAQAAYLAGVKVDLGQWETAAIAQLKQEAVEKKSKRGG